jgi:hypothetical protein
VIQGYIIGVHFRWYTDHKGLVTILQHRDVSGRRARWLENISLFDFKVIYVPGTENILSDALSHIYSNDAPGTLHAPSEYTEYDNMVKSMELACNMVVVPVFIGLEACTMSATNFVGHKSKKACECEGAETGCAETLDKFTARIDRVQFWLYVKPTIFCLFISRNTSHLVEEFKENSLVAHKVNKEIKDSYL